MATGGGVPGHLEAIVLAAGAGTRFGGGKLTAPWRGAVLIDGALAAAFAAPIRSVIVVTGADPRVASAAVAFAAQVGEAPRLRLVHAADHAQGLAASLRTGLEALPPDPALAAALAGGALAAAPVFEGRRGHPVLFGRGLFDDLRALAGDAGARTILARLGEGLVHVPSADAGVLFDVDFKDPPNPPT